MRALALLGLVGVAATGCLSVPSSGGDADGGGAAEGDAGAGCGTLFEDAFDSVVASEAAWARYAEPTERGLSELDGTTLQLQVIGDDVGLNAYADATTVAAHATADTDLYVDLTAMVEGEEAGVHVAWKDAASSAMYWLAFYRGSILAERDDGVNAPQDLCDPCPSFTSGAWTLGLRQRGDVVELGAAPTGEPIAWFATSPLLPGATFEARVYAYANDSTSSADATIERVRWLDCAGAP